MLEPPIELAKQPSDGVDHELVRVQLERILTSSAFRNSKRYASVLKYVVDRTLEGNGDQLKERTIGTEVFGRAHDYDTGTDHAVRSAVAEVRKRLAQYYQEEDASGELRIDIQPGSYVPQFRTTPAPAPPAATPTIARLDIASTTVLSQLPEAPRSSGIPAVARWIAYAIVPVAVVLTALAIYPKTADPLQSFWAPVVASQNPILLCVGNLGGRQNIEDQSKNGTPLTVLDLHTVPSQTVHIGDAITLSRIAGFMQARGKTFRVSSQADATFTDLQAGPSVLIGLMNNDWTERLVGKLRFTVERTSPWVIAIRDHKNPANNDWSLDYSKPYLDVTKDYALALRVTDPKTDQIVVAVAGISVFGTMAAGEFLTNADEFKKVKAIAPSEWKQKNVELVLATDVIRGKPGHATIVASDFW